MALIGANDGVDDAVDNVIAFDRLDRALSSHLDDIFSARGISVFSEEYATERERKRLAEGVSSPKTRTSHPKHGKVDPNNEPHVGE